MARVTCGYFWVYPYPYPCLPVATTHRSQRVRVLPGGGSIFLFNYILNDNYQTTLQAGAHRHGGGLQVGPEKWKKEKRNGPGDACPLGQRKQNKTKKQKRPGDKCLLGLSPHCLLFPLLPISFGCWWWCSPVIPSPFVIFSSPSLSSPCHPPPLSALLLLSSAVLVST